VEVDSRRKKKTLVGLKKRDGEEAEKVLKTGDWEQGQPTGPKPLTRSGQVKNEGGKIAGREGGENPQKMVGETPGVMS